jgi:hypothetical protein
MVKNEMAMYAIIATSQFKRPVCFTSLQELKELGLDKYVRQTGMSYELVPVLSDGGSVDTDVAYKNVMTKFAFGNAKNGNVYYDEENRRHLNSIKYSIAEIAVALASEGKKDSARKILRKFDSEVNEKSYPYAMTSNRGNQHDYFSYVFLQACYVAEEYELANKVAKLLLKDLNQQIVYYKSLGDNMSDDQFMQNCELAYQGKPNSLTNKQMSFVQEALSSYQLLNTIAKMGQDAAKLKASPAAAQTK